MSNGNIAITFIKFTTTAQKPTRGTIDSAGYDLYFDGDDMSISPGTSTLVPTGVGIIMPPGTYGRVAPRSGLAFKYGINVLAGVIDCDYRQAIGVILHNTGDCHFSIKRGDRIAQLIIERCYHHYEVDEKFIPEDEAKHSKEWKTSRIGGFGSTGF
jgi:dUTP pyrophosphatase